jgi:hypothetical protein
MGELVLQEITKSIQLKMAAAGSSLPVMETNSPVIPISEKHNTASSSASSSPGRPIFLSLISSTPHKPSVFDRPIQSESAQPGIIEVTVDTFDNSEDRQFFGGYGELGGHVITHSGHSILGDLKQYPFTDDIKNQADVIYNKMIYRVRRGKIRDQMLFYCVYCAHLELDRDVNPTQLGTFFNLTPGEVQRCDSIFSPLQTGYRPPSTNTSALRYLPDYCRNMHLSEDAIEEIINLARSILRKDPTLSQENPQTVAAGLLRYYIVTNGVECDDPQRITKVTGRSNVTIEGMYRRIATIDNN